MDGLVSPWERDPRTQGLQEEEQDSAPTFFFHPTSITLLPSSLFKDE